MTNREAIETIKIAIAEVEWNYPMDYAVAFETAIEALEKQIPKKPIYVEDDGIRYTDSYRCPNCQGAFTGTGIARYCYHCGQAIDWSDEDAD